MADEHGEHVLQREGAAVRHLPHPGVGQELQAGFCHADGGADGETVCGPEIRWVAQAALAVVVAPVAAEI